MTIAQGDSLPDATLLRIGAEGPETVQLSELTAGRKVVIFGLPGAFTGTCTNAHVPSFMRTKDAFAAKGIEDIVCVSVNDPFVMKAWGEQTGAADAGLMLLADADGAFTKAIGMAFDAPPAGLFGRSKRYALMADGGVVQVLHLDDNPGVCETSSGETLLEAV